MIDSGASEVIISDHGGRNPRRVPVVGVQVGTEISNVGTFSAFARPDDLRNAGLGYALDGKWLTWGDAAVGGFGGVISGRPYDDGLLEIPAEGWGALMRGHSMPSTGRLTGYAGGLAVAGFKAARDGMGAYLSLGSVDDTGEIISVDLNSQDVLDDYLSMLTDDVELEWYVDENKVFHAGKRIGEDIAHTVRLTEGYEIITPQFTTDSWAKNPAELEAVESALDRGTRLGKVDITKASKKQRSGRHRRKTVGGGRERRAPGRRDKGYVTPDVSIDPPVPGSSFGSYAHGKRHVVPIMLGIPFQLYMPPTTSPMSLDLANVNGAWQACQLGNTVRVVIGTPGFSGTFRIMSRGYDASSGVLTVSGEALSDLDDEL